MLRLSWSQLLVASLAILGLASASTLTMIIGSDLHYDPFYGTPDAVGTCTTSGSSPYGANGCDAPWSLVTSALDDMFSMATANSPILLLGDFVRHDMKDLKYNGGKAYEMEVASEIIQNVTNYVAQGLQSGKHNSTVMLHPTGIFPVEGNEDFIPHYYFDFENPVHPLLDNYTSIFAEAGFLTTAEAQQMQACGYYYKVVPGTSLRIVAFNSIIYSSRHTPIGESASDPCGQFAWLQSQFNAARQNKQKVHLISHIIPVVGKWHSSYQATFRSLVMQYNDTISAQWFGHLHFFGFLTLSKHKAPLLIECPAITRVSSDNPSYLIVTVETVDYKVLTVQQRYLDVSTGKWNNGLSLAKFGITSPITSDQLYAFGQDLTDVSVNNTRWRLFEQMHDGGAVNLPRLGETGKLELLCSMITADISDYENCIG